MNKKKNLPRCLLNCLFSIVLVTPQKSEALQDAPAETDTESDASTAKNNIEHSEQENQRLSRLTSLLGETTINEPFVQESIAVINDLIRQTRADQISIHKTVRQINRNMDELSCQDCERFRTSVRNLTSEMLRASYSDNLFQNRNLSEQIASRLPLLVEDSLLVSKSVYRREDFLEELNLLGNRFLRSRRFRAGVGVGYSYLPSVTYQAVNSIDLSPFQSEISGGSDRLVYSTAFSNQSFASFLAGARIPLVQIDASFPNFSDSQTTITTVQFRDIDPTDRDILSRSTIVSNIDVDYEIGVKFTLAPVVEKFLGESSVQHDYGVGIGLTGFSVKDEITTDVRFQNDGQTAFNDLPTSATIVATDENSFNAPFGIGYYAFDISDEFRAGIDVRYYLDTNSSNNEIEVEDLTVSVFFSWYPTLQIPWQK